MKRLACIVLSIGCLCAAGGCVRPGSKDRPLPKSFTAPPPAAESLYPAPQVDPSAPPQEAAPTF